MADARQIIAEQEASLNAKSSHGGAFEKGQRSTLGDDSGVTDAGLEQFDSPAGQPQVSVGRTGQTGGGTKAQMIPPNEGGDTRFSSSGTSSDVYETSDSSYGDRRQELAEQNPGGVSLRGDAIDAKTVRDEVIPSQGAPSEPQLLAEGEDPRDPDARLA